MEKQVFPSSQSASDSACGQQVQAVIEQLLCSTFTPGRQPRSEAYRIGTRALLLARLTGKPMACPYKIGTAEADAFFAGADEGRTVWANHLQSQAEAALAATVLA